MKADSPSARLNDLKHGGLGYYYCGETGNDISAKGANRMKKQTITMVLIAGVMVMQMLITPLWAQEDKSMEKETAQQRDARMAWWRQARFGMFVHWGLYSGLAGTWKDKAVGTRGGMEWIQNYVNADTWEYAHEAVPRFQPAKDFAVAWARLAKQAGCRYVVFTTKHHEGFALFDSQYTTYDAKDMVGRDLCAEIVDAVRAEGLKVGFYHSVIDWHHPQYDYTAANQLPHPLRKIPSPNRPRNHAIYIDYLHHQAEELMRHYGTVDIIWWDYSKKGNEGPFWRADELMAKVRQLQPGIISNNRLYHIPDIEATDSVGRLKTWNYQQGDFTTPEQTIPSTGVEGVDWEVCMTLNTTWGYSEHDKAWKSDQTLIRNLVDIVSKGGNYLLNIGPKGDGSIPEESVRSMQAIGRWMDVNSEAIYETTASPFEAPAWGRYTRRPGVIYAHVFDWPKDGRLAVPVRQSQVKEVCLLADAKTPLKIEADGEGLIIHLPQQAPDAIASVVKISYQENNEPPRKESFKVQDINKEPIDLLTIPQDHYNDYIGKKVRITGVVKFGSKGGPVIADVNGGIWDIGSYNLSEENYANKEVTLTGILGYIGETPYAQVRVGYFIQSIK